MRIPRGTSLVAAGFFVNELGDEARDALLATLRTAHRSGVGILIVEPISLRVSPWWQSWESAFAQLGGRADEWRFPADLPLIVKRLARATGLHPEKLTARSLFAGPS